MKSMLRTILLGTLPVLMVACATQTTPVVPEVKATEAVAPQYFLNASEYKLLLNPEMFTDYVSGFENYWKIINEVALAEGIAIVAEENPMKLKHKDVKFYDTPNLDLRKQGFVFRERIKYKGAEKKTGYDYVLKHTHLDPVIASSVDLTLAEGFVPKSPEIELESDLVYYSAANGSTQTSYTISNAFIQDVQPKMTYGTIQSIYPALSLLELTDETELVLVNGMYIDEWKVGPGKLDCGDGLYGDIDITIWLVETSEGTVAIPEFSFDHEYLKDREYADNAMARCTSFITKLNDYKPEWSVAGNQKSAFLFK